jgi:Flp pilus assembly protein TadB
MNRLIVVCGLVVWAGAALVLAETRWAQRAPLSRRLATFHGGRPSDNEPAPTRRLADWAGTVGARVTRLLGVDDDLAIRLERVHSEADPSAVRLQQVGWTIAGLAAGIILSALAGPPPVLGVVVTLGSAALGFLLVEHRITAASDQWKHRVADELPVVTEQLAMLLGAGYAVGPAVARIAERGQGACAIDFRRIAARASQGLSTNDALREWAVLVDVPSAGRLVSVLALDREASDLGGLIAEEAEAMRREAHRSLIEIVERRNQQVWIPVTIAALVPGAILLAIPFMAAMQLFANP